MNRVQIAIFSKRNSPEQTVIQESSSSQEHTKYFSIFVTNNQKIIYALIH